MGLGHSLPLLDIAKLFASRGVKSSIITTPISAALLSKQLRTSKSLGSGIEFLVIKFPSAEVGLSEGIETSNSTTTREIKGKLMEATALVEPKVKQILDQHRRLHCLVADVVFHWAIDVAAKFGIPKLVFHGADFFPRCVSSYLESFVIPNLPHEIKSTRNQVLAFLNVDSKTELSKLVKASMEVDERSFGILVNSFYELEPEYANHYRKVFGRKSWHIGPVSLCNKAEEDKSARGEEGSADGVHECFDWLNTKEPNSVVYICFGSLTNFSDDQLVEIALALESSHQQFIWVVKKEKNDKGEWLPDEEFEQRLEDKGLIIRGWAPQLLILEHEAVGAFMIHCGWNSILKGVAAGVPMITWPMSAEQFYNEKLVTQLLGIEVDVGAEKWDTFEDDSLKSEASVKMEAIEKVVTKIMVGDEAEEMRSRVKELGEIGSKAVEEGSSSFFDLTALIEELRFLGT
ncbi:putative flavonol 3-O-glucosyltransferase [Rosa chinensis]|uniref:Putative flavonol 3-O-glucosyltransferase n=1 Tax=Rosa chinensis TaxID=74649 RepID=A0A2P6PSD3_ROSCH|nr:putative flavonol 3-O-glucosyltransferase [Rosa chinensis]